jgi:citronellol/citronellal dehydrogenase
MISKQIMFSRTGASRGIGEAIAMALAKQGANIAIAAKTAEAHPKLPGTIYTAAKEIEAAGGKALPLIVDVRSEQQVEAGVSECVKKFGGIDILINNASAISLGSTESLSMKSYDLMHQVNARGTFLCSKVCLPYLRESAKKGRNPHILNISPPLDMNPKWFAPHAAYTAAKFGMSMYANGMAAEFKGDGINVNCLWPRTAVATAAINLLMGDEGARKSHCECADVRSQECNNHESLKLWLMLLL